MDMHRAKVAFVVAHYSSEGRVSESIINLLRFLRNHASDIIFVSTGINSNYEKVVRSLCRVIVRQNFGHDFWSYKVGIDALRGKNKLDRIVIFNSSFVTVAPALLVRPFLGVPEGPALKGVSLSTQYAPHLQSFWVSFEHNHLVRSLDFSEWWSGMIPISDRLKVIEKYEIGMSKFFSDRGYSLQVANSPSEKDWFLGLCRAYGNGLVPVEKENIGDGLRLNLDDSRHLNPSHILWDFLLRSSGIIKLDLLRKNPYRLDLHSLNVFLGKKPVVRALVKDALAC